MRTFFTILAFAVAISQSSCKKDKYQPIGDYGNANIISSNTVTLNNWISNYDDGINFDFSSIVTWGEITQDIVDKGIVMVYMQSGSRWIALPFTYSDDTYAGYNFSFAFSVGQIEINVAGYDDSVSPNPSDFNGIVIRAVAMSQETRAAFPDLNLNNYEEVNQVFKLDQSGQVLTIIK